METKEKPKDPNDPREYRAMKNGASKLFALVSTITVITVGLGWSLYRSIGKADPDVALSATLCVAWLIVLVHFVVKSFIPILNEYWLRNVCGYRLACFFGHPLTGRPLLHSVIAPGAPVVDVAQPTLLIPLGGWFRRPTIVEPKDHRPTVWPLKRGQIRMVGRLELLHQDGTADDIARNVVQLTDATGDRHTTTVWGALEILEQYGVRALSDPHDGTLRRVFGDLSRRTESLTNDAQRITAERDEARAEVQRLTEQRDERTKQLTDAGFQVIAFLQKTIKAIEESSRLKDGLEGLLLLRRLHSETIKRCEAASLAHVTELHRARLAVVDAQIAEKQKRDRRRHGRPATSPAP